MLFFIRSLTRAAYSGFPNCSMKSEHGLSKKSLLQFLTPIKVDGLSWSLVRLGVQSAYQKPSLSMFFSGGFSSSTEQMAHFSCSRVTELMVRPHRVSLICLAISAIN